MGDDLSGTLVAFIFCVLGGAVLAVPLFGFGPLLAGGFLALVAISLLLHSMK